MIKEKADSYLKVDYDFRVAARELYCRKSAYSYRSACYQHSLDGIASPHFHLDVELLILVP